MKNYVLPGVISFVCSVLSAIAWAASSPVSDAPTVLRQPLPQKQSASFLQDASAVKRVMLLHNILLCADRHRVTPENVHRCKQLAEKIAAPQELSKLLARQEKGPLSGRANADYRRDAEILLQKYGTDGLQIRLFAEDIACPEKQINSLVEWLPVQHFFNLCEPQTVGQLTREQVRDMLRMLAAVYTRLSKAYETVDSCATADACAESLLSELPLFSETLRVRFLLRSVGVKRIPDFAPILGDIVARLAPQRKALEEISFYGSVRLRALNYLLYQ